MLRSRTSVSRDAPCTKSSLITHCRLLLTSTFIGLQICFHLDCHIENNAPQVLPLTLMIYVPKRGKTQGTWREWNKNGLYSKNEFPPRQLLMNCSRAHHEFCSVWCVINAYTARNETWDTQCRFGLELQFVYWLCERWLRGVLQRQGRAKWKAGLLGCVR